MKKYVIACVLVLFMSAKLVAQINKSGVQYQPLNHITNATNAAKKDTWKMQLQSVPFHHAESFGKVEQLKQRNKLRKGTQVSAPQTLANKTQGSSPLQVNSFIGNQLKSWTPSDNSIAISNNGWIVSVINEGIEVYDTNGNAFISDLTWNGFLNNEPTLNQGKFDPRVIYDPLHDRFILCVLHGPANVNKTKTILAFSVTNNPNQGWYVYTLTGNPFNDSSWTDYPSMAINKNELFFNANLFGKAPNYNYKGTYIHQIDLDSAYAGNTLQYITWSGFDTNKYITLVPAPEGQGNYSSNKMNFVMLHPGEDTLVHLITITDSMNAPSLTIDSAAFEIPYYSVCADGYIKDPNTGFVDSISTGSAWVQNAFQLNDIIHFCFSANMAGWCGVHYGRLNLTSGTANYTSYTEAGTDLAYPAITSIGYDVHDKNTAMAFVRADTTLYPEICVISIDDANTWSSRQTVRAGDTIVNIVSGAERWGDYTGIARKYNATTPEAWLFGSYSTNTLPRRASYGNWIAQVISQDTPLDVNEIKKTTGPEVLLYPNPAVDIFSLEFDLKEAARVSIQLFDMHGRLIRNLMDEKVVASKNKFSFNRKALPNGQYMVEVKVNGKRAIKKMVLVE